MLAFGAGVWGTGRAMTTTAAPDPEDLPCWMRQAIIAGTVPYPNSLGRAPGSLGARMGTKAFEQMKEQVMADLHSFYQCLATANSTTAVTCMTDVVGLFEAICQAEEPLVFLEMMPLDTGKVTYMHRADIFHSYAGMGTELLNGKMAVFGGDVVNNHLPVLFKVEELWAERWLRKCCNWCKMQQCHHL
eukprot:2490227-Ditylum_brightwellii.AAC.1